MRKIFFLIILTASSLSLSGCIGQGSSQSALQVNSTPKTTVFLDGKHVGQTPYYNEKLKVGEYTLKLIPESGTGIQTISWEGKIKLNPDVLTVVNRDLKDTEDASSGEILNLETIGTKDSGEIMVITNPDSASIKLDGQEKGVTPFLIKNVSAGDHEITLSSVGFIDKIVRIRTTNGYKLIITAQLASGTGGQKPTETPEITPSAISITPSKNVSPVPTKKVEPGKTSVKILDTPTGWLRVRTEPSLSATEAAKVNTGEVFLYLDEESGWFKIEYQQGKTGWISSQYAQKISASQ